MEAVLTPAPGFSYGLGLQKLREQCGAAGPHRRQSGYVANALNSKGGSRQIVVLVNATAASLSAPSTASSSSSSRSGQQTRSSLIQTGYCR